MGALWCGEEIDRETRPLSSTLVEAGDGRTGSEPRGNNGNAWVAVSLFERRAQTDQASFQTETHDRSFLFPTPSRANVSDSSVGNVSTRQFDHGKPLSCAYFLEFHTA